MWRDDFINNINALLKTEGYDTEKNRKVEYVSENKKFDNETVSTLSKIYHL